MTQIHLPPDVAHLIAEGRVTQHRRLVDTRQPRVVRRTYIGGSQVHVDTPWTPTDGEVIPIRRRADDGTTTTRCHVELVSHRREMHGPVTAALAAAEGAPDPETYARRWIDRHDRAWRDRPCRRCQTAVGLICDHAFTGHRPDGENLLRLERHWHDRPVWVLTLRVVAQPLEYLAPAGRQRGADEHGHTGSENLAIDTGDYVDPEELAWHWQADARKRRDKARGRDEPSPTKGLRRAS